MFKAKKIILLALVVLTSFSLIGCSKKNNKTGITYEYEADHLENIELEDEGYTLIKEYDDLAYYYKKSNTVIKVEDKRTGYTWKTGLDVVSRSKATRKCREYRQKDPAEITVEGILDNCESYEDKLNEIYTNFANSLFTVEYYDESLQINRLSASSDDTEVTLMKYKDNGFILEMISITDIDINVKLRFQLTEKGITYEVRDEEITGEDQDRLAGILITPFLGASGGKEYRFEYEVKDEMTEVESAIDGNYVLYEHDLINGYSLVPDGSGALIRFKKNSASLSTYHGTIYGGNSTYNTDASEDGEGIDTREPVIPVFGIAHEDYESAFVGYTTRGEEYMSIISYPYGNQTHYNYTYPRFNYNNEYKKIYNQAGAFVTTLYDDRFHYDIIMNYEFLADEDASYTGMAEVYRNYLIDNEILEVKDYDYEDIQIRLDFLMADAKKSIFGYSDAVLTTSDNVDYILNRFVNLGISNINSGLLGYQKGGLTLGKLDSVDYSSKIGSKSDYNKLIKKYNELGIDISFQQDYYLFNSKQKQYMGNASKHINGNYNTSMLFSATVSDFCKAKPEKSKEWAIKQFNKIYKGVDLNSFTITGISDHIISDRYNYLRLDMNEYLEAFKYINEKVLVNADKPNGYLLQYVDRYLNAPAFNSSYVIETESVPFIQYILNGTMEVYAPYSNFSFSDEYSILRMIDFNLYPSFVLTYKSSENLLDTNAELTFFSTEYNLYEDMIIDMYDQINSCLKNVINAKWVGRTKLAEEVFVNHYDNGVSIYINYNDYEVNHNGITLKPLTSEVVYSG